MTIIMPQELEVWYLLPALRRELAKEMLKLNLKQTQIAQKLGITRAAISQYLKSKRAQKVKFDKQTQKEIKASAKTISQNDSCLIQHMQHLTRIAKQNKILCKLHKIYQPNHNCGCEACLK